MAMYFDRYRFASARKVDTFITCVSAPFSFQCLGTYMKLPGHNNNLRYKTYINPMSRANISGSLMEIASGHPNLIEKQK